MLAVQLIVEIISGRTLYRSTRQFRESRGRATRTLKWNWTCSQRTYRRPLRVIWKHRDNAWRNSKLRYVFIKGQNPRIDNEEMSDTFSQFGSVLLRSLLQSPNCNLKFYFAKLEKVSTGSALQVINSATNTIAGTNLFETTRILKNRSLNVA